MKAHALALSTLVFAGTALSSESQRYELRRDINTCVKMYNDTSFRFAHLHVRNESDGCDKFEFCKTKECTEEVDIYGEAFKLYDISWDGSQKWLYKWGV
ncbi:hypothetical protein EV182_004727 [Spiromyces aspiralis]|uniref:Uncharacterized protein n=1 Tax=Spiromyces aspiralis TaxID=68401 RepID=A0ACC1HUV5_9FUNG|nr:hypothetical protein EV182_004727 [Spiromyces aspiralis]